MKRSSKTYSFFAAGMFVVFALTMIFNRVLSEEKHAMSKMQHDWTRDERHLMDELRETMSEMKLLIEQNKKAMHTTNNRGINVNSLDVEVKRIVKEALELGINQSSVASPLPVSKAMPSVLRRIKEKKPTPPPPNDRILEGMGGGMAEEDKLEEIRQEFLHAWKAYELYAWGKDVVEPVSKSGQDEQYRMGITLLDSLDTMWIMGLDEKFKNAVKWVETSCRFTNQEVSVFETTIRALGGLLSAYHLSGERVLLQAANELATKMEPAFETPTGFPKSTVRLSDGKAWCPSWSGNSASFSEVTSLYLEWEYLSRLVNNPRFKQRVDKIMDTMINMPKIQGLYAQWVNVDSARFTSGDITLGSRVDSAYEYLEKVWRQTNRTRPEVFKEYLDRIDSVDNQLIKKSKPNGLTYIEQCNFGKTKCHGQFDHLVCFAPAMLALGAQESANPKQKRHFKLAEELTETCYESYRRMPTGLAPEIIKFDHGEDFYVEMADRHNLLRPETVESIFVMWRLTHDQKYRDWGWNIFQSFRKYTKVDGAGYSSIGNVKAKSKSEVRWRDKTESFFFAETLKYLYLLFTDDSVLPLDKYVFNTEAHPFPIAPAL